MNTFQSLTLLAAATLVAASSVSAAVFNWDPGLTATPGGGGAGTWDTTTANWYDGTIDNVWGGTGGDTAVFGGTGGGVNLGAAITAGGLTFNSTGYTLTGGTLTLAGAPTISATTGTTTINSDLRRYRQPDHVGLGHDHPRRSERRSDRRRLHHRRTSVAELRSQLPRRGFLRGGQRRQASLQQRDGHELQPRRPDHRQRCVHQQRLHAHAFERRVELRHLEFLDAEQRRHRKITSGTGTLTVTANTVAATDQSIKVLIVDNGATAVNLVKNGAGMVHLSQTNTYTGGTTITGGTLDLSGGGGGNGTIRGTVTVNTGAKLQLSLNDNLGYNTDSTRVGVVNLNGGTLNVNTTYNQTLGSAVLNLTGGSITGISGSNFDFFGGASALNSLASSTTSTVSGVGLSALRQGSTTFTVAQGTTASGLDLDIQSVIRDAPASSLKMAPAR